jgi:hypothetical protein
MVATRAFHVAVGVVFAAGAVAGGWYLLRVAPANAPPVAVVAVPPAGYDPNATRTRPLPPNPAVTLAVLPALQPGMSRAEVEDVIGLPPSARVEPIDGTGGRVTYRTAYPIDLGGGCVARPPAGVGPQCFVGFEFDATLPGHPLVTVIYPDPLF